MKHYFVPNQHQYAHNHDKDLVDQKVMSMVSLVHKHVLALQVVEQKSLPTSTHDKNTSINKTKGHNNKPTPNEVDEKQNNKIYAKQRNL